MKIDRLDDICSGEFAALRDLYRLENERLIPRINAKADTDRSITTAEKGSSIVRVFLGL